MLNQFTCDQDELGWRVAMALWLENRDSGPKIVGWVEPERRSACHTRN